MEKALKYILFILIAGLVLYNSISISKLSSMKANKNEKFDAITYTQLLWKNRMQGKLDSAIEISTLVNEVSVNQVAALDKYGNALGIGNYRYVLVNALVSIIDIKEDEINIQFNTGDQQIDALIATEYIYGNAIRDASGLVSVKDFSNTDDLNAISEAMNAKVRNQVLPPFKKSVKKGQKLQVVAAVELNKAFVQWKGLELIPIQIQILP